MALSSMGDKYKYATTFSIPVLTEDWLQAAWDNRHNIGYRSVIKLFLTFKHRRTVKKRLAILYVCITYR